MAFNFAQQIEITQTIESSIDSNLKKYDSTGASEKQNLLRQIENSLNDFQQKINQLKSNLGSLQRDEYAMYSTDISDFENSYRTFKAQFDEKLKSIPSIKNQQMRENIVENLGEAIKVGNDSLNAQNQTLNTLYEDKKILDKVDTDISTIETEAMIGQSKAKRIFLRLICHRVLWWTIVVILLAVFIFSLYWNLK